MCGFAGIASASVNEKIDKRIVHKMSELLYHRGPDDSGFYFDSGIGIGHRRLSIIDVSGGNQPLSNEDRSVWVSFNGEIYNFQELKNRLISLGHQFKTNCDTEVIVHSYEEWGLESFSFFNGMFAFALWDCNKRCLLLVRDRLGVKPLYWAKLNNKLLFSSEVKSILAVPGFEKRMSLSALSSYLTFRQAVWDLSFFKGVNKVLPGHYLIFQGGDLQIKKYYELPVNDASEDLGEQYYIDLVTDLLRKSIKRRMISDVPIGAFLSGGLDSSILVALMSELNREKVQTFSIGYEEDDYNEEDFARQVSNHCSTDHHQLTLKNEDYVDIWTRLIRQKDAPLSIPHEVALYQLSLDLKNHVTVVLSGEGADELFGGYGRVQRSPMDWKKISLLRKILTPRLSRFLASKLPNDSFLSQLGCEDHLSHFFKVYNWVPFEEKWDLFSKDTLDALDHDSRTIRIFEEIFSKTDHIDPYDRILHVFEKIHLSCLLDRLDMMSMAASVEARVPFVDDHELVEAVIKIPFHYKMRWKSNFHKLLATYYSSFKASEWLDTNKYILRKIGLSLLPKRIATRKKLGFPTPLDAWLRNGLKDYAKEILLDDVSLSRGIFSKVGITNLLESNQKIPYDFYGKKIWMLLNIELMAREFFDN